MPGPATGYETWWPVPAEVRALRVPGVRHAAYLGEPDPELGLDYVPLEARPADLRTVLKVGSGFGGFQSAMVLTRGDFDE